MTTTAEDSPAETVTAAVSREAALAKASTLIEALPWLNRFHGETVVMTNGVFDILHTGHVRYLEAAKKLGNVLIVAVNDDASVRKLDKGPSRPLNRLEDRMRVLAALKCVDWVVPFSEETPARLISRVLPDLLVKGGDYKPEQVAGYDAVRKNGGQVVILDFHKGYSTTNLIERATETAAPKTPATRGKRSR